MARQVVRAELIRPTNLGLVLEQVHRDGELTRAELTARLGLNRSTIGALVLELVELGLVTENVPSGGDRAGRPSYVVAPRADGPYALAVDIEVDAVLCAAVGLGGIVLDRRETAVPPGRRRPEQVVEVIARSLRDLLGVLPAGSWPIGIGISVPGTVHRSDQRVALAPNLEWSDLPLRDLLRSRLDEPLAGLPIEVGNDADLGALAEHFRGAARGTDDVVYLAGRVGVGAGIILGGQPIRGYDGLAGEIGHVVLDPNGPPCHCGNRGCVETYISEQAALRVAGRRGPVTRGTIDALLRSVESGDPDACAAVEVVGEFLGRTVANLVNLLNPELVVLGGWLTDVLRLAAQPVRVSMSANAMAGSREVATLSAPRLGRDSSLLGAAERVFRILLDAPYARQPVGTA